METLIPVLYIPVRILAAESVFSSAEVAPGLWSVRFGMFSGSSLALGSVCFPSRRRDCGDDSENFKLNRPDRRSLSSRDLHVDDPAELSILLQRED